MHVKQPELGNDYTFNRIKGHDRRGWDNRLLKNPFQYPSTITGSAIFSTRRKAGRLKSTSDHTKFIFQDGQDASLTGKLNGKAVDTTVHFSQENGFYYYLNNGANFLLFNLVKRCELYTSKDQNLKVDFLGKAGIGPVIPYVENSFFGIKTNRTFN